MQFGSCVDLTVCESPDANSLRTDAKAGPVGLGQIIVSACLTFLCDFGPGQRKALISIFLVTLLPESGTSL